MASMNAHLRIPSLWKEFKNAQTLEKTQLAKTARFLATRRPEEPTQAMILKEKVQFRSGWGSFELCSRPQISCVRCEMLSRASPGLALWRQEGA